jgi:hypothetical protein
MSRILILHTPLGLEEASSLVDLMEASLPLSSGDVACSSLPGYALASSTPAEYLARIEEVSAVLVLVDEAALHDTQLWFDAAVAWARHKRTILLLDRTDRLGELPTQLFDTRVVLREDRGALVALIEDLAYGLQLRPRFGRDAMRALDQLDRAPPSRAPQAITSFFDSVPPQPSSEFIPADDTEQSPAPLIQAAVSEAEPEPANEPAALADDESAEARDDEPIELSDDDVLALSEPPPAEPRPSHFATRLGCSAAFEAGRAVSECSFHRKGGEDFSEELSMPFGRFVDALGGSWAQLTTLGDIEVWLTSIDNLLEALPQAQRSIAEWYEIGFQFSTLRGIAEHGLPEDMEQRAAYQELWTQSLSQFRASATQVGITPRDVRKLQSQLENLLGPAHKRDHGSIARVLGQLRLIVETRDDQEPRQDDRAFG